MVKVAVTGATGLQGGAVVEALMASGQFEVGLALVNLRTCQLTP